MDAGIYFSDWFGLEPDVVEDFGAFDVSLINDLRLFVDPFLLFNSDDEIYQTLHLEIIRYVRFLRDVSINEIVDDDLMREWFTFPEVKQNWLGFSKMGNKGRGLGPDFARSMIKNLRHVFSDFGEETVTRGSHLEKLCLLKEGVGKDNISDFTTNLIKGFLASYTQKFAREHLPKHLRQKVTLRKVQFNYETRSWRTKAFELPYIDDDFVMLTPRDILTKDEAWINRNEMLDKIPDVADSLPDSSLRAQVNDYLKKVLENEDELSKKDRRLAIARVAEKYPELLDYYILDKEEDGENAVSLADRNVQLVETLFIGNVRPIVTGSLKDAGFYEIPGNTRAEALQRVHFLKDVIENKGGHRIFYVGGQPVQKEEDVQILYRLVWCASPSSVTREANDGRGPVDFKISRGAADTTLVEFKLAKNTQLKRNLEKQCEIYEAASDATEPSIKVIFYFNDKELQRVIRILRDLKLEDVENIVLVDASADNKPSGSKA